MSDLSSDRFMSEDRAGGPGKSEYSFYFALILACAIPIALVMWVLGTVRIISAPDRGPLGMAIEQANIVTPKIFWA